jgi:OTU domain-containing protein 6
LFSNTRIDYILITYHTITHNNRAEKEWNIKLETLQNKHKEELSTSTIEQPSTETSNEAKDETKTEPETKEQQQSAPQQQSTQQPPQPQPQLTAKEKAIAKRLRKKQNALLKEKQREEQIANEIANAPNPREMEIDTMKELYLNPEQLNIEEIIADGNCLYRAIGRQLDHISSGIGAGTSTSTNSSFANMRKLCADQLMKEREEYEPFTDLTDTHASSYEEYVEKVRASSEWGGHLELRALASALEKTIVVYSADASPLYIRCSNGGDDNDNDGDDEEGVIRLSFHRKYYALGEHYNSVVPSQS